jgi:hypothetical protein
VHDGALRVRQGFRESHVMEAGDEVAIRPGRPHTFQVLSDEARFTAEFRPAWQIAEVFRDVFALDTAGRRYPRLSDVAPLIERYPEDFFYMAFVPIALQRMIARLVARPQRVTARRGDAG